MRWLAAMLWVAAAAGCLGSGPPTPDGPTGQVDGAVVNHVLVPYANVTVRMPELGLETTTTRLGGFSFFDVPVGFHTVQVTLPDGTDRDVVAVNEGQIARLILQIFPTPEVEPYVTALSRTNIVDLAMPGEACPDCRWQTSLQDRHPDLVELIVAWDGRHPALSTAETHLIVELHDEDGTLLAGPLDRDDVVRGEGLRLCAALPAKDLPATAGSLAVSFRFDPDNELPHPDFRFESHFRLHYADQQTGC